MRTLRCLCPAPRPYIPPIARTAYLRFYSAAQAEIVPRIRTGSSDEADKWHYKERYPRIKKQDAVLDYYTFKDRYKNLGRGESKSDDEVVVRGMSACICPVDLAHAFKEEYGRFGFQVQDWDSLTCSKTVGLFSRNAPIDCNACLTIPIYPIPVSSPHTLRLF